MKVSLRAGSDLSTIAKRIPNRHAKRTLSFYCLFNPFQILRDVFFREAQRSTCAITGQPLTSNLTHHRRAGDAATKLPDILDGVLRSLALQRRASLHLLRYLLFHTSLACGNHESLNFLPIHTSFMTVRQQCQCHGSGSERTIEVRDGICLANRAVRMCGYT